MSTDGNRSLSPDSPPDPHSLVGKLLDGRYRVLHLIGVGGMSTVYKGLRVPIEREVAIKVLSADCLRVPTTKERFAREARVANRISHRNVLEVDDIGETEDGLPYQVMEFLYGETLFQRMQRGKVPLPELLEITLQVCSGLAAAHDLGIVHRDLTPSNIFLVSRRGSTSGTGPDVRILDFGIAFVKTEERLTLPGQIVGTPAYVAPEIVTNSELSGAVDIYSLGAVLYEAVSGCRMFDHPNLVKLAMMHVTDEPVPVGHHAPDVPPRLAALIMSCVRKRPAERPSTIRAVAEEVRAIMRELAIPARRSVPPAATIEESVTSAANPALAFAGGSAGSVTPWREWAIQARQAALLARDQAVLAEVDRLLSVIGEVERINAAAAERLQARAELELQRATAGERFDRALENLGREEARLREALAALDASLAAASLTVAERRRALSAARQEVAAAEESLRRSRSPAAASHEDDVVDEALIRALRAAGEAAVAYQEAAAMERAARRAHAQCQEDFQDIRFQVDELTRNSSRQLVEIQTALDAVEAELAALDRQRHELYRVFIETAAAVRGRTPPLWPRQ